MIRTCTIRGKILLDTYGNWIKKEDGVLDIGCGNGIIAKTIQEKYNCNIQGTDILDFLSFKIPFKLMKNETTLPYDNQEFDIALLNDILHHTRKQEEVLKEALRVSKKVIIFETKPTLRAKILDHVLNWGHNVNMPIPLTHKTPEQWSKLFQKINIKYEYREAKSSMIYPLSHFCFILTDD